MIDGRKALFAEASDIVRRFPGRVFAADSRKVRQGDIFIASAGVSGDGKAFIPAAAANGAAAVIYSGELAEFIPGVEYIKVSDSRKLVSYLYKEFYNKPDETVKLYAVTGTNGKTTSAFLLNFILNYAGVNCGLFSTVEYRDGRNSFAASHTTPDAGQFFRLLNDMKLNGLTACAMESSSHALAQYRLDGANIAGAVFTNLTGDHLDFHGNMDNYFAAKVRLFTELLDENGAAAVNIDDAYGKKLAAILQNKRNFAAFGTAPEAEYRIANVNIKTDGTSFEIIRGREIIKINSALTGGYNVYNLAGVLVMLHQAGFPADLLEKCAALPFQVPGRLEKVPVSSPAQFYVDYAHTDDALRNVLAAARGFTRGRLWVIFGAGGDRDKSKRPRMGKAAAEYADMIVVTSDNPRSEQPQDIIADIIAGIPSEKMFHIEADRAAALRYAAKNVTAGDVVIVAGKGHENYQDIAGVKHHFSDREVLMGIFAENE